MKRNSFPKLEAWRAADQAAYQASSALLERRKAYFQRRGPKPATEEIELVADLRMRAQALFRRAIDELEEVTAQLQAAKPR
jgi:hypothetical protein